MNSPQKKILSILLLASAAIFVLYWFPNQAASEDLDMVLVFEPDEAVPLSYAFDMIKPAENVKQALINFAFYDYYFYGYPHFAYSALLLAPIQALGQVDNTPLVMAVLRQFVSVLPMLAAILLLVYMQTGFRDYRALVLFAFLNLIPGVVQNNFWWHPDSLAILFAVLTIFFLQRDRLRFGRDFYLAAAMCGLSAQTKSIGFYFFMAIAVYLLLGYLRERKPLRQLAPAALGYIAVMALAYVISNPILVYAGVREQYFETLSRQSQFLSTGFEVFYAKGLEAVTPMLDRYFGGWLLLGAAALAALWGARRSPQRLLHQMILTWALPLTVFVFGFSIVKYHYWLPAALPLFSSLAILLPEGRAQLGEWWRSNRPAALGVGGALLVAGWSLIAFAQAGAANYQAQLTRQESSPALAFYGQAMEALAPLPPDDYYAYADVNLYLPSDLGWVRSGRFEALDYAFVQQNPFDLIMLSQTRIWDYLNAEVEGINAEQFAQSRAFYTDADMGQLAEYRLVYRDDFGLVFVRAEEFETYFSE